MCEANNKLYNEIYNLKRIRDDLMRPIKEEYQEYIDNIIFENLPFQYGDIIINMFYNETRFFIYKGIKNEYMILHGCDENGVENNKNRHYYWNIYKEFEIYKEANRWRQR